MNVNDVDGLPLIILWDRTRHCGGLGDRLLGLFTLVWTAKSSGRPWKIDCRDDSFFKYLDFGSRQGKRSDKIRVLRDKLWPEKYLGRADESRRQEHKKKREKLLQDPLAFLLEGPDNYMINTDLLVVCVNHDKMDLEEYTRHVVDFYPRMYQEFLTPKNSLHSVVRDVIQGKEDVVGVQARFGDFSFTDTDKALPGAAADWDEFFQKLFNLFPQKENFFVTSDHHDFVRAAKRILPNVISYDERPSHVELCSDAELATRKTLVDHYILSKICTHLVISGKSGFGATAALINMQAPTWSFHHDQKNIRRVEEKVPYLCDRFHEGKWQDHWGSQ